MTNTKTNPSDIREANNKQAIAKKIYAIWEKGNHERKSEPPYMWHNMDYCLRFAEVILNHKPAIVYDEGEEFVIRAIEALRGINNKDLFNAWDKSVDKILDSKDGSVHKGLDEAFELGFREGIEASKAAIKALTETGD